VRLFFVTACVLAILASSPHNTWAAVGADDPAVARGRALFARVGCYECHGYAGQGGAAGPHIAATVIPYAAFSAYVRHPDREMPAFTARALSEADLTAIYAYVRSLPAPASPAR
jgi:mono/diheme cytochrome c family protein